MADFTQSEILNEISKIFRANLDPGREGGTLNTRTEYQQLLELTATTFLINQDAVFYLARIAKNKLNKVLVDEIKVVEDTLVAVDDLSQIGKAVTDTSTLYNASNALLALDAAQSVTNRPETKRFKDLMDKYAEELRPSVQSSVTGILVRPRENAQGIIRTNLARMKNLHDKLLNKTFNLRDILQTYLGLDIPSRVANTALTSIRENIEGLISKTEEGTDTEIIERSRRSLLTALASKAAVDLISGFGDPSQLKIRTPVNPLPINLTHKGRVVGDGTPAYWESAPGPWGIPISGDLVVAVDGGPPQTLSLADIEGDHLEGSNDESFTITSSNRNLHVTVDPEVYNGQVNAATTTSTAELVNYLELEFKHLGAPVNFNGTDLYPRYITEMRQLQSLTIDTWNASERSVTFNGAGAVDEPANGIQTRHVGCYVKQGTSRWEIVAVPVTGTSGKAILAVPSLGVPEVPAPGASELRGQTTAVTAPRPTKFDFLPALTLADPTLCYIGPTIKTARLSLGTRTLSQIISDVEAESSTVHHVAQHLHRHVKAVVSPSNTSRIALEIRSRKKPFIQISSLFLLPPAVAGPMSIVENFAHLVLGFLTGEKNETGLVRPPFLSVEELVSRVNRDLAGVTAETTVRDLYTGTSLKSVQGTSQVQDTTVDFTTLVSADDHVEILTGSTVIGEFQIETVATNTLTLRRDNFQAKEENLAYRLFRKRARISSTSVDTSSAIQVTGAAEIATATGTQYGSISQFEAVDKQGNKLSFDGVVAGDLLRLVTSVEREIVEAYSEYIVLDEGLPSNLTGIGFEIEGHSAKAYGELHADLQTFTDSSSLLKKNGFDEDLEAVDNALTAAVLPGRNFASSRNKAKQVLSDLLSILTDQPRRSDEYTAQIPTAALNLESILSGYTVPTVPAFDSVIDAFLERKYGRAVDLLKEGDLDEFFGTDEETGSYAGSVMAASRKVGNDLPSQASSAHIVDNEMNLASGFSNGLDAELNFDDTEITE